MEYSFRPRLLIHLRPFSSFSRLTTWWDCGKRDVWRAESTRNRITQIHLEAGVEKMFLRFWFLWGFFKPKKSRKVEFFVFMVL